MRHAHRHPPAANITTHPRSSILNQPWGAQRHIPLGPQTAEASHRTPSCTPELAVPGARRTEGNAATLRISRLAGIPGTACQQRSIKEAVRTWWHWRKGYSADARSTRSRWSTRRCHNGTSAGRTNFHSSIHYLHLVAFPAVGRCRTLVTGTKRTASRLAVGGPSAFFPAATAGVHDAEAWSEPGAMPSVRVGRGRSCCLDRVRGRCLCGRGRCHPTASAWRFRARD
jgi:hypothetical protein